MGGGADDAAAAAAAVAGFAAVVEVAADVEAEVCSAEGCSPTDALSLVSLDQAHQGQRDRLNPKRWVP